MTDTFTAVSSDLVDPTYELSANELQALKAQLARRDQRTAAPRVKVTNKDGVAETSIDHTEKRAGYLLLMEALGTADSDFLAGLVHQCVDVGRQGPEADEGGTNFLLSVVKDVQPRDQLEAMLAAQMGAVHSATMTMARRLNHVDNIAQQDSAERAMNKLARTFATQMETLKKYRSTGDQKVTVEHVNVNQGGQAIVGNVTTGGGGKGKSEPTS